MWMKTIQQDLKSNNLSLNQGTDVAQDCPLWRLMSTFVVMHSEWCMYQRRRNKMLFSCMYVLLATQTCEVTLAVD